MVLIVLKKCGRFLGTGAKFGNAAVSKNPKAALSTITEVKKVLLL